MAALPYQGGWAPTNDLNQILGQARAAEMIQAKLNNPASFDVHPVTGCLISLTSLNNNGYASHKRYSNALLARKAANPGLDMRNKGTNILLHRAAYLALHGTDIAVGDVASHLCPFKACFKGEHIISETQAANLSRINCAGVIRCPRHDRVIVDLCTHDPQNLGHQCIKIHENISCCRPEDEPSLATMSSAAIETGSAIEEILSQDLRAMPGSQFLGAEQPDDDEEASDLPSDQAQSQVPGRSSRPPPPSSPPVVPSSLRWTTPSAGSDQPPLPAARAPISDPSEGSARQHHPRPSTSSDIQPPPRRRRLAAQEPSASDSEQEPSDDISSAMPTSEFVVDDNAPVEYESDD
jgi:hypothetical protein